MIQWIISSNERPKGRAATGTILPARDA
jgi:hypothetical protein